MSQHADITVSEAATRQAASCGFWGDPAARVRGMVARATPIADHPSGNMVYGSFVFLVRGRHVLSVTMIGPVTEDTRPVSACRLCKGLMTYPYRTNLEGREGIAHRPCPRAFDPSRPLCDQQEN